MAKTAGRTAPFSKYEWMIAWRYIRAKRADGGVSVMTWISLIGITLAVAGFGESDLEITVEDRTLVIRGRQRDDGRPAPLATGPAE